LSFHLGLGKLPKGQKDAGVGQTLGVQLHDPPVEPGEFDLPLMLESLDFLGLTAPLSRQAGKDVQDIFLGVWGHGQRAEERLDTILACQIGAPIRRRFVDNRISGKI
jgi:hypothetical protein